jgi:hypothetical protein
MPEPLPQHRVGLAYKYKTSLEKKLARDKPSTINRRESLSTIDLLTKAACFVKKVSNIFNIKPADLNELVL